CSHEPSTGRWAPSGPSVPRAAGRVFFFQAEDGIRDRNVTGVQTCALPIFAMAADRAFAGTYAAKAVETGLNFDFVTYPSWGGEYGDYGPNEGGNGLAITTLTEHPEEAFRVVEYLLSDEYQSWQAGQRSEEHTSE